MSFPYSQKTVAWICWPTNLLGENGINRYAQVPPSCHILGAKKKQNFKSNSVAAMFGVLKGTLLLLNRQWEREFRQKAVAKRNCVLDKFGNKSVG